MFVTGMGEAVIHDRSGEWDVQITMSALREWAASQGGDVRQVDMAGDGVA